MKNIKSFEQLNEQSQEFTTYKIVCRDTEGALKALIEYIKENGNTGHSFSIVVDPGDEREKSFGWDGDGSDSIESIEEVIDRDKVDAARNKATDFLMNQTLNQDEE
jgi:hypothetical protein